MTLSGSVNNTDLRECKQIHDAVWLVSVLAVVVGVTLASRMRFMDADVRAIVPAFAAYVVAYALASEAAWRVRNPQRLRIILRVVHLTSVLFLAFVWLYAGGARVPELLLVFTLPVVAAGLLMLRGQTYITATISIGIVAGIMIFLSPEVRAHLGLASTSLGPAFGMAPGELGMLIGTFGVVQIMLAFASSALSKMVSKLYQRLWTALRAVENVRTLFQAVLRATPVPEVLVHADTGRMVHASDKFLAQILEGSPDDSSLFDLVSFDAEEELRESIQSRRPSAILTRFALGGQKRIGQVILFPIHYEGDDYVHVSLRDESDMYLRIAVEALDAALIVVDEEDRLAYFNPRATALFGELRRGGSVGAILLTLGLPRVYLKLVGDDRSQTSAEMDGIDYVVATSMINLPDLGRLGLLVVRESARGGTAEIVNPFRTFYAPRYFTETTSRFLAGENPEGCFALLDVDVSEAPLVDPFADEAYFVSVMESLLRPEDLLLGLRRGRFALLAPRQSPGVLARLVEQGRKAAFGDRDAPGAASTRIHSSIVPIDPGDDLDSLMRRASASLPSAAGVSSS